jgi:hypothetical protein
MNTLSQSSTHDSLAFALSELHDSYVASVNQAVGADDLRLVDELAREYDVVVRDLTAQHAA